MQTDILNIGLAFFEGLGLIVSPCILPILPIILSGSLEGSKKRPFGIIIGFVCLFALFTYFSRQLVHATGIDLTLIRRVSYSLLMLFGLIMVSTRFTERFARYSQRLANVGSTYSSINDVQGGFFSGILFGGLVAIIWTPCAGPILAAVIVQAALQSSNAISFILLLFFGLGVAIPMLLIALFGRRVIDRVSFLKAHTIFLRKLLGFIIIASVIYLVYNENSTKQSLTTAAVTPIRSENRVINGLDYPYPAPTFEMLDQWINSPPLQIYQLRGKVVLIDFWTYSCINCVRTIPYLNEWYRKYHDKGLVIIGVHTPEFEFEKDFNNVKQAVARYGIHYPVGLDNHYATWQNYNNLYWPAHYLIDKSGHIVYQHFGEGEYAITENNIRYLLGLNKMTETSASENNSFFIDQTLETYLGSARADRFMSPEPIKNSEPAVYTFPESLPKHDWALQGEWIIDRDKIISYGQNAMIKIHFYASDVYAVMGNATNKPIKVNVLFNDKPLNQQDSDAHNHIVTVDKHALYHVLHFKEPTEGYLQLTADSGLEMYTFTFG